MPGKAYFVTNNAQFRAAENTAPDWSQIYLKDGAVFGSLYIDNDKLKIAGDATIKGGVIITADYVTLEGLTITDSPGSGVSINRAHNINLNGLEISGSARHGVYASRSDNVTVQASDIHDNAQKVPSAGVSFHISDGDGYMRVLRSHIYNNGLNTAEREAWGVLVDQDHERRGFADYDGTFTVRKTTITGNGGAGFLAYHASDVDFTFNNVGGNYATDNRTPVAEVRFYDSTSNSIVGNTVLSDLLAFSFEAGATAKMSDNTLADPHHDGGALHDDHWIF
jgi:hypothetical protein